MWSLILSQLPSIISAAKDIYEYVGKVRAAAMQAGEWTPEYEIQFQELLNSAKSAPEWQPDPK